MRNVNRINNICDSLAEIWKNCPDWRFMQLINNFMAYQKSDCFYLEDNRLIERLQDFIENLNN